MRLQTLNLIFLLLATSLTHCSDQASSPYKTEQTSPNSRAVSFNKFRALFEISTMQTHHTMMQNMRTATMNHKMGTTHVLSATLVDNEKGRTIMPAGAQFSFQDPNMQEFSSKQPAMRMLGGGMGHLTLDLKCQTDGDYAFILSVLLEEQNYNIPVSFNDFKCNSYQEKQP